MSRLGRQRPARVELHVKSGKMVASEPGATRNRLSGSLAPGRLPLEIATTPGIRWYQASRPFGKSAWRKAAGSTLDTFAQARAKISSAHNCRQSLHGFREPNAKLSGLRPWSRLDLQFWPAAYFASKGLEVASLAYEGHLLL